MVSTEISNANFAAEAVNAAALIEVETRQMGHDTPLHKINIEHHSGMEETSPPPFSDFLPVTLELVTPSIVDALPSSSRTVALLGICDNQVACHSQYGQGGGSHDIPSLAR
jgi:hypothetical protein